MVSSAFRATQPAAALLGLVLPCFSAANLRNGDIRLVGSIDYYYDDDRRVIGRLVVYYNGQWGNVCGEDNEIMYFSYDDVDVACEQLGGLEYFYYNDDGLVYEWPEDTKLTFLQRIYCFGDEHHLSECPLITWIDQDDYWCEPELYARSISCTVPPAEDVVDPEFVFDVGFSDSGIKCLRADGFVTYGRLYDKDGRRRRRGSPRTPAPTLSPFTPTPMPTPAPTFDHFEAHVDTSMWQVAACHSVYAGAGDGEVEILHKGQFSNNEVCASRTDRQPWQNLYLRLLCRVVDLNSSMVSYTSKGCGPRGADAMADTSHCLLGASAVATVQSEPPFPAAIVDECAFFSYTEYLCLENAAESETETATNTTFTSTTTATGCVDYVPPEEEKWHDADGERFDCAWYAAGPDCSQLGGGARNFNRTADEACCACGGGVAGPRTTTTRTATTASDTQTATTASSAPGSQLHEVTGSLRFSSTGSRQQVEAAAAQALAELLGVPASRVVAEASPAVSSTTTATPEGRRLSSVAGWWQVSYTVWSTLSAADAQRRSVAELSGNQAAATALFAPRFEAAGLQLETSTLEMTQVDVAGATFTDTTATTTTSAAVTTAAQADGSGDEGGATTDAVDQLPVVLDVVAAVLAGLALMLTGVAVMMRRSALKAQPETKDAAPMNASAETASARSHTSEMLAV